MELLRRGRLVLALPALLAVVAGVGWWSPPLAAQPVPRPEAGTADWRSVSAGEAHTCGIRTSGRLYCWGSDTYGQLGDGGGSADQATPAEVAGGVATWRSVAAGGRHTCALRTSGRLFCWGSDFVEQLGTGAGSVDSAVPIQVTGARTDWVSVVTGAQHTCARRSSGRLFCWGADVHGQLGEGAGADPSGVPIQVAGARTDWSAMTAGWWHTCARRSSGRLFCWGRDNDGQLGDGGASGVDRQSPSQVAGGRTDWGAPAGGQFHTCALRRTGRLFCWGNGVSGQVGTGAFGITRFSPVQVSGARTDWAAVGVGGGHTCARRTSGRLFCWGSDFYEQLGDNGDFGGLNQAAPAEVSGARTDWRGLAVGGFHTCARRSTARLYCWGLDAAGRLGDGGPDADQALPAEVEA